MTDQNNDFNMVNYKEVELEGVIAFESGLTLDDNPYEYPSAEAQSWETGWGDAQLSSVGG